jgi:hypothetical protein
LTAIGSIVVLDAVFSEYKQRRKIRNPKGVRYFTAIGQEVMTEPERIFFARLRKVTGSRTYVCPKVRVMDVLKCDRESFQKGGYRLGTWHFDFVLIDVYSSRVKLCIEYDDKSHETKKRAERDSILEYAVKSAGVKLVRFPYRNYEISELKDMLSKYNV